MNYFSFCLSWKVKTCLFCFSVEWETQDTLKIIWLNMFFDLYSFILLSALFLLFRTWLEFVYIKCVSQLFNTVTKFLSKSTQKRENFFWVVASEVLFRSWCTPLFLGLWHVGIAEQRYSLHDSQEEERKREEERDWRERERERDWRN
jgi:hypothetical protein